MNEVKNLHHGEISLRWHGSRVFIGECNGANLIIFGYMVRILMKEWIKRHAMFLPTVIHDKIRCHQPKL